MGSNETKRTLNKSICVKTKVRDAYLKCSKNRGWVRRGCVYKIKQQSIMLDDDTFICLGKSNVMSIDLTFVGRILRRICRWNRGWVRRGCVYKIKQQ